MALQYIEIYTSMSYMPTSVLRDTETTAVSGRMPFLRNVFLQSVNEQ